MPASTAHSRRSSCQRDDADPGIVLYQYGTGPVKGFAVTLCIGILTSVFTAMVVTRLLYALYPGDRRVSELSI